MKVAVTSEQKWILAALSVALLGAAPSFFMNQRGDAAAPVLPAGPPVEVKGEAVDVVESKWTPRAMSGEELKTLQSNLKIDLNHADKDELESLPGVGKSTAQAIIDYREEHGCFQSVEELRKVKGFGGTKFESVQEHLRVDMTGCVVKNGGGDEEESSGPASTKSKRGRGKKGKSAGGGLVNINTASLKELTDLPAIGKTTAERIIEYREEHGGFGSIEEIMEVKGIREATFNKIKDLITY